MDELQNDFKVSMFIDFTMIRSQRPVVPDRNAPRYVFLVQEAFYNGWKRIHGIKKQSIGLANGMAFHVSKGYLCRRHDLDILTISDIDDRLAELTKEDHPNDQFTCFGDSSGNSELPIFETNFLLVAFLKTSVILFQKFHTSKGDDF